SALWAGQKSLLNLDDQLRLPEPQLEARGLLRELLHFAVERMALLGLSASLARRQARERRGIALRLPIQDVGSVEALAPQQRTALAGVPAPLEFREHARLVRRAETTAASLVGGDILRPRRHALRLNTQKHAPTADKIRVIANVDPRRPLVGDSRP